MRFRNLEISRHLAITTDSKYIPQAFDFPRLKNEFLCKFQKLCSCDLDGIKLKCSYLDFHKTYPDKKFVVKNFDNRGVKFMKFDEIDFFLGQDK